MVTCNNHTEFTDVDIEHVLCDTDIPISGVARCSLCGKTTRINLKVDESGGQWIMRTHPTLESIDREIKNAAKSKGDKTNQDTHQEDIDELFRNLTVLITREENGRLVSSREPSIEFEEEDTNTKMGTLGEEMRLEIIGSRIRSRKHRNNPDVFGLGTTS